MMNGPQVTLCACTNLRRAAQSITQVYDDELRPIGLRVTQYSVLRAISQAGRAKITELAEWLSLDRTTLTRNLQPLVRRGLIKVAPGADQRVREVSLTPAGVRMFERAVPLWKQGQERVKRYLGPAQMEALMASLAKLQAIET